MVEDRILGGAPIALKRVEQAGDRELADSFAREFAVLASLALPGVAKVHDLGVMPSAEGVPGGPFFTRDYVEGEPLASWAQGRARSELLSLFGKVLATVAMLHRRGVVHGDLKPANIIVDPRGMPHLIDFGLASRVSDALAGSGTPVFMAPELLAGARSSMAADVYAIGATLWMLITGSAPLEELGVRVLSAKLRGELPRIPAAADAQTRALLEAALWALAPDPRERAPSSDELAARLEQARGEPWAPVGARRPFVAPRARGREPLLDELVRRATDLAGQSALHVLHGPRGMGKSTLLCELKWRLQLSDVPILEVRAREGTLAPLDQLRRQLAVLVPDAGVGEAQCEESESARRATVQELAAALSASARFVVLVDDLDFAGPLLADVLRASTSDPVHPERAPIVIASSESLTAAPLGRFVDLEAIPLPALDAADQHAIIAEALGPVAPASEESLIGPAAGNPGILVEALAWLWERGDLTARDLHAFAPGAIGAALAGARVKALGEPARLLLTVLAFARGPVSAAWAAGCLEASAEARAELGQAGLVREEAGALVAAEPVVNEWLRANTAGAAAIAQHALDRVPDSDPVVAAELSLIAGDAPRLHAAIAPALEALCARGDSTRAVQLCEACLARGVLEADVGLTLSELYVEVGDSARAVERAEALLQGGGLDETASTRARVAAARGHVTRGDFDRAIALLSTVSEQAPRPLRAQAARELARIHLRRGEADAAQRAVDDGLRSAGAGEPGRAELIAIAATLGDQRGEHAEATQLFEQALTLARGQHAPREEALVLGYRAMSHERRGAFDEARRDYEAGLTAARRAGDLGLTATYASNLGNVSFRAGHLDGVEQHYTLASRLSRRSGRIPMALLADNNLASLHLYLGSFARARVLAESSLAEAQRLGIDVVEGHALHILGNIDARTGNRESALARCEAAAVRYGRLGRSNQLAEVCLHIAEILLDRGGVSDISAASARLAQAREIIERHGHEDFRFLLRLLIARARAGNGDHEGALKELSEIERLLPPDGDRELAWQVLAAQAELHAQLGASLLSTRKAREAAELIEALAAHAPRETREAFLADPRRRAILKLASPTHESAPRIGAELLLDEPRFARLLELIKRLARERDLDRLLERITDAAVDLSGAERGFVLLVDEKGQLAPHTVRVSGGAETDPLVAFSRSIAEAVLIDGEPIVTVNARDDRRLNEFMSVHKLMLKSVACIPISGHRGVVGVLYLEHRLRAGRFQESDVDLLLAFADQAAIAIENARLWSENEKRRRELEAQAGELAKAKADIERLLETRTEELAEVRRDLGRARAALESQSNRHGIVGQSVAMRRVYALIDRVADSPVPIVIEGESGTGKELVARAIHFGGARRKEPFVALNCAALPEHLLESELFGHVRGAFTGADRDKRGLFQQANGGTIFLDEFADVPPRMQLDLLRVLQERRIRPVGAEQDLAIDVRVIAATNRPLKQLVASGRLREDLYYRMSVVEIRLPTLRERIEDVPLLCDHLLSRLAEQNGGRPRKLSRAALERILASDLPGNVRQLEHLLTSAAMLADGPLIEPSDLGLEAGGEDERDGEPAPASLADGEHESELPSDLNGYKNREKQRILDALEKHNWNRAKAATALGMPRRTFYRRLTEFNIL